MLLFVLDFEANCKDDGILFPQEIIEVPVMVYDTEKDQVVAKFHQYCTPLVPITPFCTKLTGITQDMVDAGKPFVQVLADLERGVDGLVKKYNNVECLFVTCGDWDLATALPKHCKFLGLPVPKIMRSWCNIKKVFREVTQNRPKGMMGMLRDLDIAHVGRHHSGIDDVRNILEIARKLNKSSKCKWRATGTCKEKA